LAAKSTASETLGLALLFAETTKGFLAVAELRRDPPHGL
jgi:hypothetical protein